MGSSAGFTKLEHELYTLLRNMSQAEHWIALIVNRATTGWDEAEAVISLSQFEEESGLSRPTIVSGMKDTLNRSIPIIGRRAEGNSYVYFLIKENIPEALEAARAKTWVVKSFNQLEDLTGKDSLPAPVKKLNRSAKRAVKKINQSQSALKERENDLKKNDKEKREGADAPPSLSVPKSQKAGGKGKGRPSQPKPKQTRLPDTTPPGSDAPPAEQVHWEVFAQRLEGDALELLHQASSRITDLEKWREICQVWDGEGHNPSNVVGLLDWYRKGIPRRVLRALGDPRASPKGGEEGWAANLPQRSEQDAADLKAKIASGEIKSHSFGRTQT